MRSWDQILRNISIRPHLIRRSLRTPPVSGKNLQHPAYGFSERVALVDRHTLPGGFKNDAASPLQMPASAALLCDCRALVQHGYATELAVLMKRAAGTWRAKVPSS